VIAPRWPVAAKFNRLHLLFRNDETLTDKTARASQWTPAAFSSELPGIEEFRCRDVAGASATWTVFSADVRAGQADVRAGQYVACPQGDEQVHARFHRNLVE